MKSVSIYEFFQEFFHEDHEGANIHVVVLQPEPPSFDMMRVLRDPLFSLSVSYLEGSALLDRDLSRAKADTSIAVFIMTNKFTQDPDEDDARTILEQFALKRYIASNPRASPMFFLQMIKPENRRHLVTREIEAGEGQDLIVCLNEVKMGVIARSVLFPVRRSIYSSPCSIVCRGRVH